MAHIRIDQCHRASVYRRRFPSADELLPTLFHHTRRRQVSLGAGFERTGQAQLLMLEQRLEIVPTNRRSNPSQRVDASAQNGSILMRRMTGLYATTDLAPRLPKNSRYRLAPSSCFSPNQAFSELN